MSIHIYNQLLDKFTRMGCVGYGIGHIFLFKFGIFVTNNFLIKTLEFFQKLGVRDIKEGASFSKFYKKLSDEINKKLNIETDVITQSVYKIRKNDTGTWGLGIIKYHSFGSLVSDGIFDKEDVSQFIKKDGVGHHIVWDGSNGGYLINSDGTKPIKCSLDTLKYMADQGMIRYNVRTIVPVATETIEILDLTLKMLKAETKGKLNKFLETNKGNVFLGKAHKIFIYGR